MKGTQTVSDSKTLFHESFPFVIPSLYKRIVDEMLVELNLLNHQKDFFQEDFFFIGLTETFKNFTKGYKPEDHLDNLFEALCKSTNFNPDEVKESSKKGLKKYQDKSINEIIDLISNNKKLHYSRLLILGIYKVSTLAKDYEDNEDLSKIKVIQELIDKLGLSKERAGKDISLYKSNIKRFEQAKELLKETISEEREKRDKDKK